MPKMFDSSSVLNSSIILVLCLIQFRWIHIQSPEIVSTAMNRQKNEPIETGLANKMLQFGEEGKSDFER